MSSAAPSPMAMVITCCRRLAQTYRRGLTPLKGSSRTRSSGDEAEMGDAAPKAPAGQDGCRDDHREVERLSDAGGRLARKVAGVVCSHNGLDVDGRPRSRVSAG